MRKSLLYHNNKRQRLVVAVTIARRQFESAFPGQRPVEVRFNPAQRPDDTSIAGLDVTGHHSVPVNYIRVISEEPLDES